MQKWRRRRRTLIGTRRPEAGSRSSTHQPHNAQDLEHLAALELSSE